MVDFDIEAIQEFGEKQYDVFCETDSSDGLVSFLYDGMTIFNPFMNEQGMPIADPVHYYGEAFLNSNFARLFRKK